MWISGGLGSFSWAIQAVAVLFVTVIIAFVELRLTKRLHQRLKPTPSLWDDALVKAIQRPLYVLIWLFGIAFIIRILSDQFPGLYILELFKPIKKIGTLAIFVWFVMNLVRTVEARILEVAARREDADITLITGVGQLVRVALVIASLLVLLQTFGVSISAVIAFGGVGGIAVGFAAKDLLANFFGGFIIFLDRPFEIGNWIRSPDREIEGFVEHIGWRVTRIRTFDRRPLFVPNSVFSTISVENPSRMTHRRIKSYVGVRYDDAAKMRLITEDIRKMIDEDDRIDKKRCIRIASFEQFGPSSMDIFLYLFINETRWEPFCRIQEDIYLKIVDIIEGHGAQIAFPTTTLNFEGKGGFFKEGDA